MITDGKKWHYLAVKKLSTLFKGVTKELLFLKLCSLIYNRK